MGSHWQLNWYQGITKTLYTCIITSSSDKKKKEGGKEEGITTFYLQWPMYVGNQLTYVVFLKALHPSIDLESI